MVMLLMSPGIWTVLLLGNGDSNGSSWWLSNKSVTIGVILPVYSFFTVKQSVNKHLKNKLVHEKPPIDLG